MSISFVGVVAPPTNTPLIEFEMPDGSLLDLYNEGWLQSVAIEGDELTFSFVMHEGASVAVRFGLVRNLRASQPDDWVREEARQIDHLLFRPEGQSPGVYFIAGGITYEFDATEVVVERT